MDHRVLLSNENATDSTRLALQPREVKFPDFLPSLGSKGILECPLKAERRGFRPTIQKVQNNTTSLKASKHAAIDGIEIESGDDDERRRGLRQRAHDGAVHGAKTLRAKAVKAHKAPCQYESNDRIEISGNALCAEGYGFSAVNALAVLGNCVVHERRLKEQLAGAYASKMSAFRCVITLYLTSVKQCEKPFVGRRRVAAELALAQCAVVAQTLIVTIQSYLRSFQSRQRTHVLNCVRRSGLDPEMLSCPSVPPLPYKSSDKLGSTLSETTSSLHDLLDDEEISRLKQLYFDYYDCDVYVIPGTRPDSGIPPNAHLLSSLSAHDPFLPEGEVAQHYLDVSTSLSSSTTSAMNCE